MIENKIKKMKSYVHTIAYGRNNFPPQMRLLLAKYGDMPVIGITVSRSPLPNLMDTLLDKFSLGIYYKRIMNSPYDKLFHLRLDLKLQDGTIVMIEKNEVLTMALNPKPNKDAQNFVLDPTDVPNGLTVNIMLQGASRIQGNKFYRYSAINNNCQDFVLACLNGSGIHNQKLNLFVKQNVSGLFGDLVNLRKGINTVTDIAAKANELIYGSGIKPIDEYVKILNHLISHISDKEEPVDKRDYNQAIELINQIRHIKGGKIAYKEKPSINNKMKGTADEKKIIDKMNHLAHEIHEHQRIHGGKIHIANAFKNLGHSVESGFHQASNYVTAKKGGLASDLLHTALPAATGALGAAGAEALAPEGGPVSGFVGNQAGTYAGTKLANYIGSKTGTGLKGSQAMKDKMARIRAMKKK